MTIKQCDRCGAQYEYVPSRKMNNTYQLRKKQPENITNIKVVDLCPACRENLRKWFEECEE